MKFGKLTDIEEVDFMLPPDHPKTAQVLQVQGDASTQLQFYIGCTGWSMKEWVGKVYPVGTKAKDYLKHYAKQFNTIELNTTHYRIPSKATVEKWYTESTKDFKFCPKIPQTISHSKNLGIASGRILEFCEAIQGLEEKLGCCFMQFPPYFGKDRLGQVRQFIHHFPNHIPLAMEFRHESWYNSPEDQEALFQLLAEHGIATVITDVAGRRDVLHMCLTKSTAMVRFVGNGLHPTDYTRITDWITRIKKWQTQGVSEIYFFPHEPDNLLAPDLADFLANELKAQSTIATRGPEFIKEKEEGNQMSLF